MSIRHTLGATWGILGITLILSSALARVYPHVLDAFAVGLSPLQWVVLVVWSGFMLLAEGYRGFQKQFAPRVAARAWHLFNHGNTIELILAPFYCIGYFHATRKRMITSWSVSAGITLLIVVVSYIAQPWRGIIDAGVILGLSYGLAWIVICTVQTFRTRKYLVDPEVPAYN